MKPISNKGLLFDHVVGTGGIGYGIFFSLEGNHTLGRNESRLATLLPYKDFCKQHIILHYISVLLGSDINGSFRTFPIGKVGNDAIGKELVQRMKSVGMETMNISISDDSGTLFSVCFQYPDHTGGNITTLDSASSKVSPEDICRFFQGFDLEGSREIIVAAPEVPLETRIKLLEYGRKRKSLNTASLSSSEVDEFKQMNGFEMVDILSVNIDEAGSIAKMTDGPVESRTVVNTCINALIAFNPEISVLITDGANGSYCYDNKSLKYTPAFAVPVHSTAGAGDAFLAGTLVGLCCGLPLSKDKDDAYFSQSPLQSAVELGTLLASLSVTSADTIYIEADASVLYKFAVNNKIVFGDDFLKVFRECI
ncbi:MAG: carbohydrate kinase family protein [Mangrovibacterium sp.]